MNSYIENAKNSFTSDYEPVNNYKNSALQTVDDWATNSTSNMNNAYEIYDKANQAELQNSLAYNQYLQNQATNEFNDTAREIDTASRAIYNRSGVANEQMKSAGLSGSGYEETLKGQNQQFYQSKLASAETPLSQKISDLKNQYRSLVYQGDVEAAASLQNRIAQAQQINETIIGYTNSIISNAYSQDFSERQFGYQKNNDDRNYNLNLLNSELNQKSFNQQKTDAQRNYDLQKEYNDFLMGKNK